MTILVTGGAGYIGSHAVRALQASGYEVLVLDNLVYGHRSTTESLGVKLVVGQVGDRQLLQSILRGNHPLQEGSQIDAVMHFAAYAYVGESTKEPAKYYRNNVGDSMVLLEALLEEGKRRGGTPIPLVFSSTCATYGIPDLQHIPINENCEQRPINPYGHSKLMIEQMIKDIGQSDQLPYCIFRYFNAAGAHPLGDLGEDHNPETHLIPLILQSISDQKGSLEVYGTDYDTRDGTCIRDYIHVCDLADAHLLGLQKLMTNRSDNMIYNLGTGNGYTVNEVIQAVESITQRKVPVKPQRRRAGDPPILVASADKARNELGWLPKYSSLETMIKHAWEWHQLSI